MAKPDPNDPSTWPDNTLRFSIKFGKHWGRDEGSNRALKPELVQWLEDSNVRYRTKFTKGGGSKIYFDTHRDAMLFKLAWV